MTRPAKRGFFITLEGIDGAGKTTQSRLLVDYLRRRRYPVVATREPGGTRVGEQIRSILVTGSQSRGRARNRPKRRGETILAPTALAELALMYAARAQHVGEVVRPALARGSVVVSDRYNDSSLAYQGYARQLGPKTVRALDRIVCGATQPDLTLLLDFDPRRALRRARGRDMRRSSIRGRFEAEGLEFQQRARAGYLVLARRDPQRVRVVRADRSVDAVHAEIRKIVGAFLSQPTRRTNQKGKA